MRLLSHPTSAFARKVVIVAIELGLMGRIAEEMVEVGHIDRHVGVLAHNPLGQVPTLILDDGTALADSRVICEYLDDLGGGSLFPREGFGRWRALARQSAADGLMNAGLFARGERIQRPPALQWDAWYDGHVAKIRSVLDAIEAEAGDFGAGVDIGTIAIAAGLSYLDLRYPELDWRASRPVSAGWFAIFAERPSMTASVYGRGA